jgi:tetratricopeptide (TPR) repeat protein
MAGISQSISRMSHACQHKEIFSRKPFNEFPSPGNSEKVSSRRIHSELIGYVRLSPMRGSFQAGREGQYRDFSLLGRRISAAVAAALMLAHPVGAQLKDLFKPLPPAPESNLANPKSLTGREPETHFGLGDPETRLWFSLEQDIFFTELESDLEARNFDKLIERCNKAIPSASVRHRSILLRFRGLAYAGKKQWTSALRDYAESLKEEPESLQALRERADIYEAQARWKTAARDLEKAVRLGESESSQKGFSILLNGLAWLRATCPDKTVRDGEEALRLARRACDLSQWRDANAIDTLAAAYAEKGRFQEAAAFQEEAMWMGKLDDKIRTGMAERLALYRRNRPYREEPAK